jgi:hypothetical protein
MVRRIGNGKVAFFRFELDHGNAKRRKVALQELCALYRRGFVLSADQVTAFEATINGIVLQDKQDAKVVRWCLNALAQFGRLASSRLYVEAALTNFAGEPEIEAAGVAALCRMYRGSVSEIEALSHIDPVIWKLAALQNTDPAKIAIGDISIDIYKADPAVLRLALITVGLNKDIENLFHPKHKNAEFVRHLGQHDDSVVQQYSVWSVIENRRLTFEDLGIPIEMIERLAPNVQSKMYQLVAERDHDHRRRLDITSRGSIIAPDDAREGLARGVKDNYYDGLEEVTLDWFRQERHKPVREMLAEHIARFSNDCGPYEDLALEINEADPSLRSRLLLGAEGRPLYGKLKGMGSNDLLEGLEGPHDLPRTIREQAGKARSSMTRRVLMLTASPLDARRVRIDEEYRDVREKIQQITSPKIKLEFVLETAVRSTDLLTRLLNAEAEIFHFSGHASTKGLILEDASGASRLVDTAVIAGFFQQMAGTIKCAVLNACFTQDLANVIAAHIEVVIGCDSSVDDEAAIAFSRAFYQSLATGRSYKDSFVLAVADMKANGFATDAAKYHIKRR